MKKRKKLGTPVASHLMHNADLVARWHARAHAHVQMSSNLTAVRSCSAPHWVHTHRGFPPSLGQGSRSADMPNLPCARSTGKGSTLGPLTKCQRVGAGPALGRDELELPKLETSAVSDGAGPLWPENARKRRKVGNRKSGRKPLL